MYFSGSAARGVGTAIMLAHMSRHFQRSVAKGFVFCSDAVEQPERPGRFRVGVLGLKGTYKSLKCRRCILTLQQTELSGRP